MLGDVKDQQGATLPGATVTLTSLDTGAELFQRPAKPLLDPPRRARLGERLNLLNRRTGIRWRLAAHCHVEWRGRRYGVRDDNTLARYG